MTDYYRPRQQQSRSDPYHSNNYSRNQHQPADSFASSFLSSSSASNSNAGNTNANSIKCSDCASWVDLEDMGEHRCSGASTGASSGGGQRETEREKERRRPSMRIQTDYSNNSRMYDGAKSSSRSALDRDFQSQYLPVPTPTSTSSRSVPGGSQRPPTVNSNISSSSSFTRSEGISPATSSTAKLPFFERYNKLIGSAVGAAVSAAGVVGSNVAGVATTGRTVSRHSSVEGLERGYREDGGRDAGADGYSGATRSPLFAAFPPASPSYDRDGAQSRPRSPKQYKSNHSGHRGNNDSTSTHSSSSNTHSSDQSRESNFNSRSNESGSRLDSYYNTPASSILSSPSNTSLASRSVGGRHDRSRQTPSPSPPTSHSNTPPSIRSKYGRAEPGKDVPEYFGFLNKQPAGSSGSVSPTSLRSPVSPKSMRSDRDRDRDRDRGRGIDDDREGDRERRLRKEEREDRHGTLKGSQSASNIRRSSRDGWDGHKVESAGRNVPQNNRTDEISFGNGSSRKEGSRLPVPPPPQLNTSSVASSSSTSYSNPQAQQRSLRPPSPNELSLPPVHQAPRFNPSFQPSSSKKLGLDDCMKDLQLQFSEPSSDEEDDTVFRTFAEDRRQSALPINSRTRDNRNRVNHQGEEESRQERRSRITRSRSEPIPQIPSAFSSSLLTSHHLQQQQDEQSASSARSKCTTCRSLLPVNQQMTSGDGGQVFCKPCYEERFLPKCRKCSKAISGGSVASSDGKVSGKYHPACFSCFECSMPFPNKEFYVYDQKPYCQQHYHELNGSICKNGRCGKPIEGQCVSLVGEENGGGGRYHPEHFVCTRADCRVPLLDHHFVLQGLPYCELHSVPTPPSKANNRITCGVAGLGAGGGSGRQMRGANDNGNAGGRGAPTTKAKKRMTFITKR